jgi:thaumarchaeosortase
VYILSLFTIFYFASLELFGFQQVIKSSAGAYSIVIPDSWTLMWDFIIFTSFLASALFILFGTRFLKVAPAAIIYLAGSAIILSLDAFFPYDSLGPLQTIVPFYLEIDEMVVNWVDKQIVDLGPGTPAAAEGNSLVLTGLNGPFALRVYWPSAGVNSLIIYSSVMLVFLLKMQIPTNRRVAYFVIGTLGTVAVNIVRIISLSFFPLLVTSNIQEWEGFHSIAGEIMFLPWIFVYLITIRYVIEHKTRLYVTNDSNNPN